MDTIFLMAQNNIRLNETDSVDILFFSSKEEALKLAKLLALDIFNNNIEFNPNWRFEDNKDSFLVYEESNPKWQYEFTVSEMDSEIYSDYRETNQYKLLQKRLKRKEENNSKINTEIFPSIKKSDLKEARKNVLKKRES